MKLLTTINAVIDRSIGVLAILAGIVYTFIMLSMNVEVFQRYLLGRSTLWLPEVLEYSLLFITFLGATWVLKREGHVKMDVVISRLNPRSQSMINMITSALGIIICLVIAFYGVRVTWHFFQIGYVAHTIMEPPKWPFLAIIPLGSFMLSIQFIRRTYGYLCSWRALRNQE